MFQLRIAAIAQLAVLITVASQASWKRIRPVVVRDVVLLPAIGFLGLILLW